MVFLLWFFFSRLKKYLSESAACFIALLSVAWRLAISSSNSRFQLIHVCFHQFSFSRRRLQTSILISTNISLSSARDGSTGADDDSSVCPGIASVGDGSKMLIVWCSSDITCIVAILDLFGVPVSSSVDPRAPRLCFLPFTMCWLPAVVIKLLL